jgi:hypothetical protein
MLRSGKINSDRPSLGRSVDHQAPIRHRLTGWAALASMVRVRFQILQAFGSQQGIYIRAGERSNERFILYITTN